MLQKKKNLRMMRVAQEFFEKGVQEPIIRSAPGGLLVMDAASRALGLDSMEEKVKTERPPSADEIEALAG